MRTALSSRLVEPAGGDLVAIVISIIAASAAFVLLTGEQLPAVVASHFDGSGAANDTISRDGYLAFMVALVIGLPGAMMLLGRFLGRAGPRLVNLPNRDYWLAEERLAPSMEYLVRHLDRLAVIMAVFFAVLHAVLLEANRTQPPALPPETLIPVVAVLVIAIALWTAALYRRFPRPPRRK
jgi:uncharacterized membrane protein